ncbi:Protein kinase domain-containing protein [Plasmodiophora brassicae]
MRAWVVFMLIVGVIDAVRFGQRIANADGGNVTTVVSLVRGGEIRPAVVSADKDARQSVYSNGKPPGVALSFLSKLLQRFRSKKATFVRKRLIGKGSFAHVYLACKPDNPHDKFVVKVFDIPSSEDDVDDERDQLRVFARNEYSIASRLSHPNIVETFGLGRDELGHDVVFFEYCSGGDLSRWVYRASDDGQLVRLCRQILGGVSYMHSQGVAHLDLKLENILVNVGNDGHVHLKICDFSTSQVVGKSALVQGVLGSVPYIAPEIWEWTRNRQEYDGFIADMWSIGIIFFVLAHQFLPWSVALADKDRQYRRFLSGTLPVPKGRTHWISSILGRFLDPDPLTRIRAETALKLPELSELHHGRQ